MENSSKVLIVDDEASVRRILQKLLKMDGYNLYFAKDGIEALKIAEEVNPDIILLDVMLPEMDGFEVCTKIRENPQLAEIPVVMVTALSKREARLKGLEVGADDFISKPFDLVELKARVAAITRLNRYRKLQQERSKFENLFEFSPVGCVIINSSGQIQLINSAMCAILGTESENLIGKKIFDFLADPKKDYYINRLKEILRTKEKIIQRDLDFIRTDGEVFPAEASTDFLDWSGEPALQVIIQDVTERKQTEAQLKKSRQELRNLFLHLQTVKEEERKHIAREIHDTLGQYMTALKMDLFWLNDLLPEKKEEITEQIESMEDLIDQATDIIHKISEDLRPPLLDDLGFIVAMESFIEEFAKRTGINCEVLIEPKEVELDQEASITIFRIFQESLTNIMRHAQATKVKIQLKIVDSQLNLRIEDNGKGITQKQLSNPKSYGIMGMRERIAALNGDVKISGGKNKGTTVEVFLPLSKETKKSRKKEEL